MASDVSICNLALQALGAERIVSLLQDSENARACNAVYEHLRDAELRAHPWNFAIKRAVLAPNATAPAFGYSASFAMPPDCLRLLPPDPANNYNSHDWQIEGRDILTNDSVTSLNIRYIRRITDPNQFDSLFIQALSKRIAFELAEQLTQSNTKGEMMRIDYRNAITEARKMNAFENVPSVQPDDTWITARL